MTTQSITCKANINIAEPVSGSLGPAGGAEQEYDVGKVIEVTCVDVSTC